LMDACERGDIEGVSALLRLGAKTDIGDCFCETPLWKAAAKGQTEIAKLLLDRGASLEVKGLNCSRTPLVVAIDRGQLETAKLLLMKGAHLPTGAVLGRKLRDAAEGGELERARALLHFRASTDSRDAANEAPLHKASAMGRVDLAKLLIEHRADLEAKGGESGQAPLHYAMANQRLEMIHVLLGSGASKSGSDQVLQSL